MPTVNNIDDRGIKDRLKKSKTKEAKEALQLIKALENALQGQQNVTSKALIKIREQAAIINEFNEWKKDSKLPEHERMIKAIKRVTEQACQSKEEALKFLQDAGIV